MWVRVYPFLKLSSNYAAMEVNRLTKIYSDLNYRLSFEKNFNIWTLVVILPFFLWGVVDQTHAIMLLAVLLRHADLI